MNIHINNKTSYRTDDLRRFVDACARVYGGSTRKITFVYSRRVGHTSGIARVDGGWIIMRLPRGRDAATRKLVPVETFSTEWLHDLAFVLAHEMQHNHGCRHEGGSKHGGTFSHGEYDEVGSWWTDLTIRARPPKEQPSRDLVIARAVRDREARARANLERALRRLKRAQTLAKKWQSRVAYYDRKRVAAGSSI